ncbi:tRNA pseudouridine(55) synthase TruB [Psittacicella gerlachiana]|uniref:tRNA pseudouridine synthase B n=1 Tax=Psittacicella gerlachiana TaxID=2028574 RepID=A0A3A1YB91_9GAMM|nr:tRNA pseudouridine(55) synthase TruB [Psittacicella gerlachiana]RIY34811.1 tRNA pseudouridine(55) synthase TruB [Psittacicella gerlachiana]
MSKRRDLDGVLLFDKPLEVSSNNILQRIKYLYRANKAGHTGALDPLASGMLPICFGESTKMATMMLDSDKEYEVTIHFGVRTNTSDREGEIIATKEVNVELAQIQTIIAQHFTGEILQKPTIWSALKYQGKPLYEYARKGIEVPIPTRPINIYEIEILAWEKPFLTLRVYCSKGTYIRTLADDLGEMLGCGGHVSALRRTKIDGFNNCQMVTIETLEALAANQEYQALDELLLPLEAPVSSYPALTLSDAQLLKLCLGMTLIYAFAEHPQRQEFDQIEQLFRIYHHDYGFIGMGHNVAKNRLRGYRLRSNTEKIARELKAKGVNVKTADNEQKALINTLDK